MNGHPEIEGLCLALADWSEELRIIQREEKTPAAAIHRAGKVGGN